MIFYDLAHEQAVEEAKAAPERAYKVWLVVEVDWDDDSHDVYFTSVGQADSPDGAADILNQITGDPLVGKEAVSYLNHYEPEQGEKDND